MTWGAFHQGTRPFFGIIALMSSLNLPPRLTAAREMLAANDFAGALLLYEKLTREFPAAGAVWFEYGAAAAGLRQFELVDRAWEQAMSLESRNTELITMIGHRYQALRQPVKARACFGRAALADPRAINPRVSLAVVLERNHLLAEARAAVAECLAIDPREEQALYLLAVLDRREGALESAERQLRDLLAADPAHPFVRYSCRYELAQLLDQTGRFEEAMVLLAEAKQLVRDLTDTDFLLRGYDHGAESARQFTRSLPRDILRTWDRFFPARKRRPIPPLVFLGGHPRSGTTLLERVLDAHPQVAALDEPTAFVDILQPAFYQSPKLSSERVNQLRAGYIAALLHEAGPAAAGRLLVDKNPSPTARLPIWLRLFPELRVLIALRDPRDVALSCYFQNIPLNTDNVNFLSLERVAKHYADLMDIWLAVREWEGFQWLETRYEDLVADLPREGRRVTEFLGLTWQAEQARFHESSVRKQNYSPTYQDVTRPVYSRSVARWHAYERHLAPILPVLEPYCRVFGYS